MYVCDVQKCALCKQNTLCLIQYAPLSIVSRKVCYSNFVYLSITDSHVLICSIFSLYITDAQNSQEIQQTHQSTLYQPQSVLTGAVSRTPARLPEGNITNKLYYVTTRNLIINWLFRLRVSILHIDKDVTALADRDNVGRDRDGNKNAVSKTYHTLKDLISSKFKKDSIDTADELNNVVIQQHMLGKSPMDEIMMPRSAVPLHMRQMHNLNQVCLEVNGTVLELNLWLILFHFVCI